LKLLFADDEPTIQKLMRLELPRRGHEVTICPDGLTAVACLEINSYDCMIVDLDMPGMSGIEVIRQAKELAPDTDAVILTGKSTTESAIEAVHLGAFDYLTKPASLKAIDALLVRVANKRELTNKYRAAKHELEIREGKSQLIGDSPALQQVRNLISKVAPTNSTVLIRGETGTGKELVARAVHDQSARVEMQFVTVNCGALPETLIESELFGHRKGAFTGANEQRVGLFEVASGGTLFLDEIGELPKPMQSKLLRVLESGEVRRVGDNEAFHVDVRVVCATHRNLELMVADGDFREDLMFRINPFEIELPPLRNRLDDLSDLATHLLERFKPVTDQSFTDSAIELLKSHSWPGNVRELANVVEHASILSDDLPITADDLPRLSHRSSKAVLTGPMPLKQLEMIAIHDALERNSGSKPKAAGELGISVKTLYNKLNQEEDLRKAG
jgi:two-component system NtrC family response regulator